MTNQAKAEIIRRYWKTYQKSTKCEKTRILNIITETTGYSRKHAVALLTQQPRPEKKNLTRARSSRYAHLYEKLKFIWATSNFL